MTKREMPVCYLFKSLPLSFKLQLSYFQILDCCSGLLLTKLDLKKNLQVIVSQIFVSRLITDQGV